MNEWLNSLPNLITASLAIYAVSAWQRDFIGRRRIELAEEVLGLFYQAKDKISAIRNVGAFVAEAKERQKEPNETDDQKSVRDTAFTTQQRLKEHSEFFARIYAIRYQCMARFGRETESPFDDIHRILVELNVAINSLYRYANYAGKGNVSDSMLALKEKSEARIWEGLAEGDDIKKRMDKAIEDIERITLPLIKPASLAARICSNHIIANAITNARRALRFFLRHSRDGRNDKKESGNATTQARRPA